VFLLCEKGVVAGHAVWTIAVAEDAEDHDVILGWRWIGGATNKRHRLLTLSAAEESPYHAPPK